MAIGIRLNHSKSLTPWRTALSQNELQSNHGPGRFKYKSERNAWVKLFRNRLDDGAVTKASGRRIVRFTRVYSTTFLTTISASGKKERTPSGRIWDRGNLVGGFKPILDAMQPPRLNRGKKVDGASVILGDDTTALLDIYEQEATEEPNANHVRFEVWEAPSTLARNWLVIK